MIVFTCSVCGHIEFSVESPKCPVCASPAEKFTRNDRVFEESAEKSKEAAIKHMPVVTVNRQCMLIPDRTCVDVLVRIGATLHPMEDTHYIRFIECYVDDAWVSRIVLSSGMFPAGGFHLKRSGTMVTIVENCNVHGYWKTEVKL